MTIHKFQPNWVSPPGDSILDILRYKSLSLEDFAQMFGETTSAIDALVRGRTELTIKHAKKLESLFGSPYTFWLAREEQYRNDLRRSKDDEERSLNMQWLSELPLKDMIRFGWLKPRTNTKADFTECLKFFDVTSVDQWRDSFNHQLGLSTFRTSSSFAHKPLSVAAWLRKGEIDGLAAKCSVWNAEEFQASLNEIRTLTRIRSPLEFLPVLKNICANVGVAVAVVRAPTGCRASGAARFITPGKALIILSFRHLTDDHFWFTFFHEAGHLLLHKRETVFIDGLEENISVLENEANTFAQSILISKDNQDQFKKIKLNAMGIVRFAKDVGVSPGIVVGQMQNCGQIPHDRLNGYKHRYTWEEIDKYLALT